MNKRDLILASVIVLGAILLLVWQPSDPAGDAPASARHATITELAAPADPEPIVTVELGSTVDPTMAATAPAARFEREPVDPAWAARAEARIRHDAGAADIRRIECRSTACRLSAVFATAAERPAGVAALVEVLQGARYLVVIERIGTTEVELLVQPR